MIWKEIESHPGTVPLIGLTLLGGVAGGWQGAAIMFALFGSVYLYSFIERRRKT